MCLPGLLYLSRLDLNLQSAAARQDLLDPYQMHRTVLQAFDASRRAAGALFRLEAAATGAVVLVQSWQEPDWSCLPGDYLRGPDGGVPDVAVKVWRPRFAHAQLLRFRLRANPTFKRGRRRLAWLHEGEQLAWLQRQGERSGFTVLQTQLASEGFVRMAPPGRRRRPLTCHAVLFDGLLTVTEPSLFSGAVARGLGSCKAFGFGLLSLASVGKPS